MCNIVFCRLCASVIWGGGWRKNGFIGNEGVTQGGERQFQVHEEVLELLSVEKMGLECIWCCL